MKGAHKMNDEEFLEDLSQRYIEAMKVPGDYWGGDVEIEAIGHVYNCRIQVQSGAKNYALGPQSSNQAIHLVHDGGHYNLLHAGTKHQINPDGDCLFSACIQGYLLNTVADHTFQQSAKEGPDVSIRRLREDVASYLKSQLDRIEERYRLILNAESLHELSDALDDLNRAPFVNEALGRLQQKRPQLYRQYIDSHNLPLDANIPNLPNNVQHESKKIEINAKQLKDNRLPIQNLEHLKAQSLKIPDSTGYDILDKPPYKNFKNFIDYVNFLKEKSSQGEYIIEINECVKILKKVLETHKSDLTHFEFAELGRCKEPQIVVLALKFLIQCLGQDEEKHIIANYQAIERFSVKLLSHFDTTISLEADSASNIYNLLPTLLECLLESIATINITSSCGIESGIRALIPLTFIICSLNVLIRREQKEEWKKYEKAIKRLTEKVTKHVDVSSNLPEALKIIRACLERGIQEFNDKPIKKKVLLKDTVKMAMPVGYAGALTASVVLGAALAVPTFGLSLLIPLVAGTGAACLLIGSIIDGGEIAWPYLKDMAWHCKKIKNGKASPVLQVETEQVMQSLDARLEEVTKLQTYSPEEMFQWVLCVVEVFKATDYSSECSKIGMLIDAIILLFSKNYKNELKPSLQTALIHHLGLVHFKNGELLIEKIKTKLEEQAMKTECCKKAIEDCSKAIKNNNKQLKKHSALSLESSWTAVFEYDNQIYRYYKETQVKNHDESQGIIIKTKVESILKEENLKTSIWCEDILLSLYNYLKIYMPLLLQHVLKEHYRRRDFIRHIDPNFCSAKRKDAIIDVVEDFFELTLEKEKSREKENSTKSIGAQSSLPIEWDTDLFNQENVSQYVLVAPSGAGKTTLMHHMLVETLARQFDNDSLIWKVNQKPVKTVILIQCKDINRLMKDNALGGVKSESQKLEALLHQSFFSPLLREMTYSDEAFNLEQGIGKLVQEAIKSADNAILLLDAYDELGQALEERDAIHAREIVNALLDTFKRHIVSVRPSALKNFKKWRKNDYSHYLPIQLEGLSKEKQKIYIQKYFEREPETASSAINILNTLSIYNRFPSHLPLCLDALCFALSHEKDQALFSNRQNISLAQLYMVVVQKLLYWNKTWKLRELPSPQISDDSKWKFFRLLAYKSLNKENLTEAVCQRIAKEVSVENSLCQLLSAGLLVKNDNIYEFIHPQYQAFLAAYHFAVILLHDKSSGHMKSFEKLTTKYNDFFYRPIWEMALDLLTNSEAENVQGELNAAQAKKNQALTDFLECIKYFVEKIDPLSLKKIYKLAKIFPGIEVGSNVYRYNFYMRLLNVTFLAIQRNNNTSQKKSTKDLIQSLVNRQQNDEFILIRMIEQKQLEVALRLVKAKGIDLNVQDIYGDAALHCAIQSKLDNVVLALVNNGANLDIQNISGHTPLHLAIEFEHKDFALKLIDAGADIGIHNKSKETSLHLAIDSGLADLASSLIDNIVDLDTRDCNGSTPLDEAIYYGMENVIYKLIVEGAKLDDERKKWFADYLTELIETESIHLPENLCIVQINENMSDKDVVEFARFILENQLFHSDTLKNDITPDSIPKIDSKLTIWQKIPSENDIDLRVTIPMLNLSQDELLSIDEDHPESLGNWHQQQNNLEDFLSLGGQLPQDVYDAIAYFKNNFNDSDRIYEKNSGFF